MARTIQESTEYRRRLDNAVTAFSLFIRELCPEAELDIAFTRYEDEDAHIRVFLPPTFMPDEREKLANCMAEKSIDVLLEDGLLIIVGVEDPS